MFYWLSSLVGEGIVKGISLVLAAVILVIIALLAANILGLNVKKINLGPVELEQPSTNASTQNSQDINPPDTGSSSGSFQQSYFQCSYEPTGFAMYPGGAYTDNIYYSGYSFVYDYQGQINIGYDHVEQIVTVAYLTPGEWSLEYKFPNLSYGAFYACVDSSGQVYGAVI